MAVDRGKQFEQVIRQAFECVPDVSVDRLLDPVGGYVGVQNICDFIVYKKPYEYYIECKTVHGSSLRIRGTQEKNKYGRITNNQWEGMLEKSKIKGVFAGVICWWVDKDVTLFLPIQTLKMCYDEGWKSVNYVKAQTMEVSGVVPLKGTKKRVFFDYDMDAFFREVWV